MLATKVHLFELKELRRFPFFQKLRKENILFIHSHTGKARVLASECPEASFIVNTSATVLYHSLCDKD